MAIEVIYLTHPNETEANKIVSILLEKKLIACSVSIPAKSSYIWEWAVASEDEVITILKTRKWNFEKVKNAILEIHPYSIPCIIKIDAEANKEYEDWVNKETNS